MQSEWTQEIARHYAETYGDHPSHPVVIDLAELQPDDVVLDIGCGSGNVVRLTAAVVTEGTVTGVDPTPEMVRLAREHTNAPNVAFHRASAGALPADDDSVSVVLAVHSLHHWDDVGEGLDEVRRVLAPNGRLVIVFEEHYGTASGGLVAAMLSDMGFDDIEVSVHDLGDEEELQIVRAVWHQEDAS